MGHLLPGWTNEVMLLLLLLAVICFLVYPAGPQRDSTNSMAHRERSQGSLFVCVCVGSPSLEDLNDAHVTPCVCVRCRCSRQWLPFSSTGFGGGAGTTTTTSLAFRSPAQPSGCVLFDFSNLREAALSVLLELPVRRCRRRRRMADTPLWSSSFCRRRRRRRRTCRFCCAQWQAKCLFCRPKKRRPLA